MLSSCRCPLSLHCVVSSVSHSYRAEHWHTIGCHSYEQGWNTAMRLVDAVCVGMFRCSMLAHTLDRECNARKRCTFAEKRQIAWHPSVAGVSTSYAFDSNLVLVAVAVLQPSDRPTDSIAQAYPSPRSLTRIHSFISRFDVRLCGSGFYSLTRVRHTKMHDKQH